MCWRWQVTGWRRLFRFAVVAVESAILRVALLIADGIVASGRTVTSGETRRTAPGHDRPRRRRRRRGHAVATVVSAERGVALGVADSVAPASGAVVGREAGSAADRGAFRSA